ncbi:MAG: GDP-L-fucose synthase [Thermoplasmata archaeon]|nr:MAG: GDP-L-fucose synthase [Thermoplasmata archaeon]RLF52125.1 MAG: GDP-L-fucose synthase [Thermoplasmata archaeon]
MKSFIVGKTGLGGRFNMGFYEGKKVLVTGGTGLIGRPLVEKLIDRGAIVRIASLDDPSRAHPEAEFYQVNLTRFDNCLKVCKDMDFVFHLAGIKGSPAMTMKKPASFFVPTILFNTNMMEAAWQNGVERYLFTSTIGVYSPAEIFREDDVWKTFPSENDKFAGWAKRMGELQAEAYKIEYGWDKIAIVRPANVYGPYDNFDPNNAMVIPSLIKRALDGENPLVVWGDGSPVRDFIHADDVAEGMLLALEKGIGKPINLGSGRGVSIKEIVDIIVNNMEKKPKVIWDTSKPTGDKKRLMDISRAKSIGFKPKISIEEGIKGVMKWYMENKDIVNKRYNVFTEKKIV